MQLKLQQKMVLKYATLVEKKILGGILKIKLQN